MTTPRPLFLASLLASFAAAIPAQAAPAPAADGVRIRRFALMIGVNDGGPSRPRLRYATSDARSMARVLQHLGGLAATDTVFVAEPSRAAVAGGFDRLNALVQGAQTSGVRRELVLYYSGHSDEEGLLLGRDRFGYGELRDRIQGVPAEVRVAILDSCASGAFTRRKGGVLRPPFLMDASSEMKGHAFLTSSSATEAAQESDRISASFFTHFLVSGLRGAADVDRNRRVSLLEAYQFASQETLARTERTRGGPQHAAYEFDLAGSGEYALTDVRTTQAGLVLTSELSGRITVRQADGTLVAELRKAPGRTIELGLEAGQYVVVMDGSSNLFETRVALGSGERVELAAQSFRPGPPREVAVARGEVAAEAPGPELRRTPIHLGLFSLAGDEQLFVDGFSGSLIFDRVGKLSGTQISLGLNAVDHEMRGVQMAVGGNIAGYGRGLQMSAGFNLARKNFRGLQMTSGVNIAGAIGGAQMGVVNVAAETSGLQMAVVNVSDRSDGAQIGVVNVGGHGRGFTLGVVNVFGKHDGEALGVLSLVGNGIHNLAAYATDTMASNLSLKLGGRHLYTALTLGFHPGSAPPNAPPPTGVAPPPPERLTAGTRRVGWGLGIGYRIGVDAAWLRFVEIEAHHMTVHSRFEFDTEDDVPRLAQLRAVAGWRLAGRLTLLTGLTGNVAIGLQGGDLDVGHGILEQVERSGNTTVRIYPGLLLGLQI